MNSCKTLTKEIAYKLMQKAKKLTKPGSGLIYGSNDSKVVADQFIQTVVCQPEQLPSTEIDKNANICLQITSKHAQTEESFKVYYEQILSNILQMNAERIFAVMVQYTPHDATNVLKIIRFLQQKQCFIFIKTSFLSQPLEQYQHNLAQLSYSIFQQPMILLPAISLIVDLPLKEQYTTEQYSIILLGIWSRTLPTSLGSVVIQDWSHLGYQRPIFKAHFLKKLKPHWPLQFTTTQATNSEDLGCECVGID